MAPASLIYKGSREELWDPPPQRLKSSPLEWVRGLHAFDLKRNAVLLVVRARTLMFAIAHPKVPWLAKISAVCAVGYLFSPVQLIPTFIPVIGQLDDVCVLYLGMRAVRRLTPPDVLAECEARTSDFRSMKRSGSRSSKCVVPRLEDGA